MRPLWARALGAALAAGLLITTGCAAERPGASAAGPTVACRSAPDDGELDTEGQGLYPGRPDAQGSDHEAVPGDCVRLAGYTAFVEGAVVRSAPWGVRQLVVTVRVRNRDDVAQPFSAYDWRLQDAGGRVIDPSIPLATDDGLRSGDLVPGGEAVGDVAFDAGLGTYVVIYKPDPFNDARGIWRVTATAGP